MWFIFGEKHKNLSKSPEISMKSQPLFSPGMWFTARLPKPPRSQQPHLMGPSHQINALEQYRKPSVAEPPPIHYTGESPEERRRRAMGDYRPEHMTAHNRMVSGL